MGDNHISLLKELDANITETKVLLEQLTADGTQASSVSEAELRLETFRALQSIECLVNSFRSDNSWWRALRSYFRAPDPAPHPSFSPQTLASVEEAVGSFNRLEEAVKRRFESNLERSIQLKGFQTGQVLSLQRRVGAASRSVSDHIDKSQGAIEVKTARLKRTEVNKSDMQHLLHTLEQSAAGTEVAKAQTEKSYFKNLVPLTGSLALAGAFPPLLLASCALGARQVYQFRTVAKAGGDLSSLKSAIEVAKRKMVTMEVDWETVAQEKKVLEDLKRRLHETERELDDLTAWCTELCEQTKEMEATLADEVTAATAQTLDWRRFCAEASLLSAASQRDNVFALARQMARELVARYETLCVGDTADDERNEDDELHRTAVSIERCVGLAESQD